MVELRVIPGKAVEERKLGGNVYCTTCGSHGFRLLLDQHDRPFEVECFNCRALMPFGWSKDEDGPTSCGEEPA
jgi:hypothetical protein